MNILFASAEVDPFAKVGGLADVVGSLPKALRASGIDARVLMPDYGFIDKQQFNIRYLLSFQVPRNSGTISAELYTTEHEGVPIYFLRGLPYFGQESGVYDGWNYDVPRFIFFAQAIIAAVEALKVQQNWFPEVIHAHDWHTGILPFLVMHQRNHNPAWAKMGTMFTIHNLAYQGEGVGGFFWEHGVPAREHSDLIQLGLTDNMLAIALAYSDVITTVSPRYALEIQGHEAGYGLDPLLRTRMRDLHGILNGIDYDTWNPATDPHIVTHYDADNFAETRILNKRQLQADSGLPVRDDVPLIGLVSRLVWQKGIDLAIVAMRRILAENDVQFIALGTGEPDLNRALAHLGYDFKGKAAAFVDFNAAVAQRIYAGSDIFLMPSRYEPCGVGQMLAMRYGSLPLVRETGGLADTVSNYDNGNAAHGTGFVFDWATPDAIIGTMRWALNVYRENPTAWQTMQSRAMHTDFSWTKSAREYIHLYGQILMRRH